MCYSNQVYVKNFVFLYISQAITLASNFKEAEMDCYIKLQ